MDQNMLSLLLDIMFLETYDMNLSKIFNSIGSQMLSDFEQIQTQIKHMGERGNEREQGLKCFLENYLPSRYAITTGEIVDREGNTSRQCDLIIYDRLNHPLLLAGKNVRILLAESVFAVIEVKSVLTSTELKDSVEKIKWLKELKRDSNPIPGVVFAYKASVKKDPMLKVTNELKKLNNGLLGHQYIDLLCVLDSGVIVLDTIFEGYESLPQELINRRMCVYQKLELSVLLWFFTNLIDLLELQPVNKTNYEGYVRGLIGEVRFVEPAEVD